MQEHGAQRVEEFARQMRRMSEVRQVVFIFMHGVTVVSSGTRVPSYRCPDADGTSKTTTIVYGYKNPASNTIVHDDLYRS